MFISNSNDIKGAETTNNDLQQVEASVQLDVQTQKWVYPHKVWFSNGFFGGSIPLEVRYHESPEYGLLLYRGWLTRTNRTDGLAYVIYEGYLYKPGISLPIPASARIIKE
ncbi:hypothetical protein LZ578_01290 [Jeotgalibaca sp. MA1X17-3]|uniref:hypothetical protein n=1 Tax=Jeotgalibaca sp. MA1X17-3 TaxID=2908211 RepID=UPI001F3D0791|nr:hypothetical protein [Jeotgalibaca sp. MA1X17-3]UJF15830.1 hypothetical protein LZ578_01290 [Jeotgalibaca sp. MA1X17-3]